MEDNTVPATWYLAKYKGEQALRVKAEMSAGIGYYLRSESGTNKMNYIIEVAFRMYYPGPIPSHVMPVTEIQAKKLDELYNERHRVGPDKATSGDVSSSLIGALIRNKGLKAHYLEMQAARHNARQ